ncbi:pimeloyl-ACP methyl ester esterase BioH [Marinobacterium litorale]|uniref:pimeloyl-ACP methyl ester esterase BioH n=1 Tax=Marinobacterium litorale TaxID=404770 RepID=UPI00041706DD|nr:pimeloyl-ACP methyl ester esterase BioH [Marinobacterium litorale]
MTLYVEQRGERGPELVLLHGWGLSSDIWQPLVDQLAERYRLTLIDLPGLGRSEPLTETTLDSLVEVVLAKVPERALWVGWSLGGTLAVHAAAKAPGRISALMLVAASPCFVQRPDWSCGMEMNTFKAFERGLVTSPVKTLNRFAALQTQGSVRARQEFKLLKQVIADSPASSEGLVATLGVLRADLRPSLGQLRGPVTVLLGEHDPLVPVSLKDTLVTLIPDARVVCAEHSAHLPFLTEPDLFIAELDELAAQSQRGSS